MVRLQGFLHCDGLIEFLRPALSEVCRCTGRLPKIASPITATQHILHEGAFFSISHPMEITEKACMSAI